MRKFLALIAAAAFVLVSCTDDPQVSLDKSVVEFTHEGGSCDLTVSSNCDWEIICSSDDPDLVFVSQTTYNFEEREIIFIFLLCTKIGFHRAHI